MQPRQLRRAAERQALKDSRRQHQASLAPQPAESPTRAEINRENSKHSTGPRTAQGKATSSQNSFQHGLHSKLLVARDEDPAALDALKADLRAEHLPANTTEEILVNEMAEQFWRIRRFRERETRIMLVEPAENATLAILKFLPVIQRFMSAAERGFHKALTSLRQLQKDRGFVPHSSQEVTAEDGFVPQEQDSQDAEGPRKYSQAVATYWAAAVRNDDCASDNIEFLNLRVDNPGFCETAN
jgi:hypothetical protein